MMQGILFLVLIIVLGCDNQEQSTHTSDTGIVDTKDAGMSDSQIEDGDFENQDVTGIWQGTINIENETLTVIVTFNKVDAGYSATVDIPNESAFGIPASEVNLDNGSIQLVSEELGGEFMGEIDSNGNLVGIWYQNDDRFPISLQRRIEPIDYTRPQDPVEPYPYIEREVQFRNEEAGIELAGTLTIPEDARGYPIVILVTGSGPQNRNEEIMNHRPFLVIADYLTRHGIATLRYDDRGVGRSQGDFSSATSADFSDDVGAAVEYVLADETLNITYLGLVGHSEGGMIAPVVALQNSDIDFIVMLAGTVYSGEEILYQQTEAMMVAQGYSEAKVKQNLEAMALIFQIVKDNPIDDQAEEKLRDLFPTIGITDDEIEIHLSQYLSPWFRYFLTFESRPALEQLQIPVLALNGTLDLQVIADKNLQAIEEVLKTAGNTMFEIKKYEGLNHLFQHATTGLLSEYVEIEETFSEAVLADIVNWIKSLS